MLQLTDTRSSVHIASSGFLSDLVVLGNSKSADVKVNSLLLLSPGDVSVSRLVPALLDVLGRSGITTLNTE